MLLYLLYLRLASPMPFLSLFCSSLYSSWVPDLNAKSRSLSRIDTFEPRFLVWKQLDNFCFFLVNTKTSKNTKTIKSVGIKSQDSINSFKQNLIKQNLNNLNVEDVDVAYDNILVTVPDLFENKNCPIVKKVVIKKYREKPWITK